MVLELVEDLLVDLVVVVVEILMGLLLVVKVCGQMETPEVVDITYLEVVEVVLDQPPEVVVVDSLHNLLMPEIILQFELDLVEQELLPV